MQSIWYNSPLSKEKFVLLNELSSNVWQPVHRYQGGKFEIRLGVEETDLAVSKARVGIKMKNLSLGVMVF